MAVVTSLAAYFKSSNMAGTMSQLSAERLQSQELLMETPKQAECDRQMIGILRDTQALWAQDHPNPKLLVGKSFPTSRRDCFKIPYSMLEKTDSIVSPEYNIALRAVLDGRFPEVIQLQSAIYSSTTSHPTSS